MNCVSSPSPAPPLTSRTHDLDKKSSHERNVQIVDLGGGTFDVSLLDEDDRFCDAHAAAIWHAGLSACSSGRATGWELLQPWRPVSRLIELPQMHALSVFHALDTGREGALSRPHLLEVTRRA
ncbi:hypothetical protein T492DRAFT_860523 [Pavlovales sp. CCMP2436]|nr:hypothetical protein T492DRAFT_860523 [Pavlovales sp. CCMP2436]